MDLILFIILLILKIIGIILISLIVLLLLILSLVVFVPIKYHVFFEKFEKINFETEIKWFFKLILVNLKYYNNDFSILFKIFKKEIINTRKDKKDKKDNSTYKEYKPKPYEDILKDSESITDKVNLDKKNQIPNNYENEKTLEIASNEKIIKKTEIKIDGSSKSTGATRVNTKEFQTKKISRFKAFFNKRKNKKDKKKKIKDKGDKSNEFSLDYFLNLSFDDKKTLINHVFIFIKRVLRHTAPKNITLNLKIGTDDPALTGQIIGGICAISVFIKSSVNVVGDFEKKVLEGDAVLKGRIQIFYFIYSVLRLIKVRVIWKTIILFLKGTGGKDGK